MFATALLGLFVIVGPRPSAVVAVEKPEGEPHRSPIALALSADGTRLVTANQTSGSVSLVDTTKGTVLDEIVTGDRPDAIAITPDGKTAVVTHWYGYDLAVLKIQDDALSIVRRFEVGPEPRGVTLSADGKAAFVTLGVTNEVVRVSLEGEVQARATVGREPRGIALTPDGSKLLVGSSRGKSMSVLSASDLTVLHTIPIEGVNLRQVAIAPKGDYGYVANIRNRGFATTSNNIEIGWVLGQRLTRVKLDGSEDYETLSLDPQGQAFSDVHGVAIRGPWIAISSAGTHEIILLRTDGDELPWRTNGSRDLIAPELSRDPSRFHRLKVGGRPTELAFSPDAKTLYAANYFGDSVQVIDPETATIQRTIPLGGPSEISLARQGEILFHDGDKSFHEWYSCSTCHSEGHTNGQDFDTMNDGWHDYSTAHRRSRKKVPTLRRAAKTGPWTWHGWQEDLGQSVTESLTKSMQGKRPSPDELKAFVAYIETLDFPRNPYRNVDGSLTEEAQRGEMVFNSSRAACSTCHGGPEFTDGKIHTTGLEEPEDVYKGYNPPSLRGLYDHDPYLHDGRAATLSEVLTDAHSPDVVSGSPALTEQELNDLIAYLKSL
jgi:YVTN family beta-propeller protein